MSDNEKASVTPAATTDAAGAVDPLAELEQLRLKALSSQKIRNGVFLVCAVAVIVCGVGVFPYGIALGIVVAATASLFAVAVFASSAKSNFAKRFKEEIVAATIKSLIPDARYTPNRGISKETIADTGMMKMGNVFESEDLVEATLSGVSFKQSDVTIIRRTHGGEDGSNKVTLFGGRWIVFDGFNKEFIGDTLVFGKGFDAAKSGSSIFNAQQNRRHKIELEDAMFNERFSVYTNDDHEVYYILTPQVMRSLLKIDTALSSRIILCFVAHQVHVGLSREADSFEPKMNVPIAQQAAKSPVTYDLLLVRAFMEALQIDHKIFDTYEPAKGKSEQESGNPA